MAGFSSVEKYVYRITSCWIVIDCKLRVELAICYQVQRNLNPEHVQLVAAEDDGGPTVYLDGFFFLLIFGDHGLLNDPNWS